VVFGSFWTFLYNDSFNFAPILDWFRMIRFLGELIRFAKAFIVTVVGGVGELVQVLIRSKALWEKSLCKLSMGFEQGFASLVLLLLSGSWEKKQAGFMDK